MYSGLIGWPGLGPLVWISWWTGLETRGGELVEGGESFPVLDQGVLDTTDARPLAEFYRQLLGFIYRAGDEPPAGGEPDERGRDWLVLHHPSGMPRIAFQQVAVLRRSTWPGDEIPQHLHLLWPFLPETGPPLPRDFTSWREPILEVLSAWDAAYFQHIQPEILRGLQAHAEALSARVGSEPAGGLVEEVTNGLLMEPSPDLRTVTLVPQYPPATLQPQLGRPRRSHPPVPG